MACEIRGTALVHYSVMLNTGSATYNLNFTGFFLASNLYEWDNNYSIVILFGSATYYRPVFF